MDKTLNLKASDGKLIPVSVAIKDMCVLIKDILQGTFLPPDRLDSPASEEIPIPQYDSATIQKVVDYCNMVQFKNDVPYVQQIKEESKFEEIVRDEKERNFITSLTDKELQNLVVAANFLNIKRLIELCCARLAYFFRCNNSAKHPANSKGEEHREGVRSPHCDKRGDRAEHEGAVSVGVRDRPRASGPTQCPGHAREE